MWYHCPHDLDAMQAHLTHCVASAQAQLSMLPQLNQTILTQCTAELRPILKKPSQPTPSHRSVIAQLWRSYRLVRNTRVADNAMSLFLAWKHAVRVQQLKKRLTQSCKQTKVARLQTAVDAATTAALRHDTRTVFAGLPNSHFAPLGFVAPTVKHYRLQKNAGSLRFILLRFFVVIVSLYMPG